MRSASGAPDDYYDDLWTIFAARGMGASATTPSANATNPTEAYDAPTGLRARGLTISDPYPGGDNDGHRRAGRAVERHAAHPRASAWPTCPACTGTLTSATPR